MPFTHRQLVKWQEKQSEKALEGFDLLENLLIQDEGLLRNLYNDDMDIREELSYLGDTPTDFDTLTDDNINWIYETMRVNLKERYDELISGEESEKSDEE